jgi:hypothetical protein
MTLNEAILIMAIGFMIIVGIWLTALTYMVLGRSKKLAELEKKEESLEEKLSEEEHQGEESPKENEESQEEEPAKEE